MPMQTTPIIIHENGDESHESWIKIGASHITSSPGAWLFDSDIPHQHFIRVTVSRCTRKRDLSRDWLYTTKTLMEVDMSQAQWGAFVSSFGQGGGVPATLVWNQGEVSRAPAESRFDQSHKEVKEAGTTAIAEVQEAFDALEAAFEAKAGRRELKELINTLHYKVKHVPANMEFASKSLTEHVENVVQKARADIEGMVLDAIQNGQLDAGYVEQLRIGPASE